MRPTASSAAGSTCRLAGSDNVAGAWTTSPRMMSRELPIPVMWWRHLKAAEASVMQGQGTQARTGGQARVGPVRPPRARTGRRRHSSQQDRLGDDVDREGEPAADIVPRILRAGAPDRKFDRVASVEAPP